MLHTLFNTVDRLLSHLINIIIKGFLDSTSALNWSTNCLTGITKYNSVAKSNSPVAPVSPSEPVGPVSPGVPGLPLNPGDPVAPVGPSGPAAPVSPGDPSLPGVPSAPDGPVAPVGPPAGPVGPVAPDGPGTTESIWSNHAIIALKLLDGTVKCHRVVQEIKQ